MITATLKAYCASVNHVVAFIGRSVSYVMPMLAFVVAFEVFARYFLNKPTVWAYDLSLFMAGYIAALGGAYAQQKRAHINVDILYIAVSANTKRVFNLLSSSLAIFFMAVVIFICLEKFNEAVEFNYRRFSEWSPPMHHFWMMMVISASLIILQFSSDMIEDLYHLITGRNLIERTEEVEADGN